MSWSVAIPPTIAERFATVVEGLELPDYAATMPATVEVGEQFRAAKRAVLLLFFSGALGDQTQGVWMGSLGGHANVNHAPTPGWSYESMNISLSQTDYPPYIKQAYEGAGLRMPGEHALVGETV